MILVFGSLNMDLVFAVETLPRAGETILTEAYRTVAGGKGANQAVAAARAAGRPGTVAMAGCVGEDGFGEVLIQAVGGAGVDVAAVARSPRPTGCASIMVDRDGRNVITVASGANLDAAHALVPEDWLDSGTVVLLQNEVPPEENRALARRARARGAHVILNAAPARPLPAPDWTGLLDLLIVNESELEAIGGPGPDAAAALARALGTPVLATLGAEGAVLTRPDGGGLRVGVLPGLGIVDTTAAGDGFLGALAAALHEGADMAAALRRASVAGGLACTRPGAQPSLAARAEIEARLGDLAPAEPFWSTIASD
ncbi:MAG TPA: PfkB family carbohydrate kinase [Microvirga sp.]|jgi:ribokinase|nr:PfkB family carbohydrate kinase [Microvirga sp.]